MPDAREFPVPVPQELTALREALAAHERVVVAFSGGVDSGLLAWVARDVLGPDRTVAVTTVSPSLAPSELADCRRLAESWQLRWIGKSTWDAWPPCRIQVLAGLRWLGGSRRSTGP